MNPLQPSPYLLDCQGLSVTFRIDGRDFKAVNNVSFQLARGEVLGVVGESGCGKSMMALAQLNLVPEPGYVSGGRILFQDQDLRAKTERQMQAIRGNRISMIFQEPMTSLNPVFRIGRQVAEVFLKHQNISRKEAGELTLQALEDVGIPAPHKCVNDYPHQLSGGMRQRVMIAMAIGCNPDILIADEATTALDVTIQAQILELMKSIVNRFDMSILFITHDLGLVAELCDRVVVMYAGKIVETATVTDLFDNPVHPYTDRLLKSIPKIDSPVDELTIIPGRVPNLTELARSFCPFEPRCLISSEVCRNVSPELQKAEKDHYVSCHHYGEATS
ncbi:ABC transporter ATP-binding protein [bacterium]|nr:ABC transporter ATP-binding protein [bacterium]